MVLYSTLSIVLILLAELIVLNLCIPFNPSSNRGNTGYPEIEFELISKEKNYDVFEYKPPEHDEERTPDKIRVASPVHFSNEKIIYWEHRNSSQYPTDGLSAPVRIKFKLTCKSLYIARWKINSDSADDNGVFDGPDEQDEASYMSYNVNLLSRDNENPSAHKTADSKTSGETNSSLLEYNVTELAINWFGPKFRSGFVECVGGLNNTRKLRLHIFQRITDPEINPFVRQRQETLEENVDTVVPCTVHDPEKKPKLELNSNPRWDNYSKVQANYSYNWKIGFTRENHDPKFLHGTHYNCHLGNPPNRYSLTFVTESKGSQTSVTQIRKSKFENANVASQVLKTEITRISEGSNNFIKFVCSLNTSRNANSVALTSITVAPCISPYYCWSSESEGSDSSSSLSVKNCNKGEVKKCELNLPSATAKDNIQIQGRMECGMSINGTQHTTHLFYFTGLSGKMFLMSQNHKPPPEKEIFRMTVNKTSLDTLKIRCESLKFFTFPSIKIYVTLKNGESKALLNFQEKLESAGGLNFKEITTYLQYFDDIERISCYTPPYNSPKWLNVSWSNKKEETSMKNSDTGITLSPTKHMTNNMNSDEERTTSRNKGTMSQVTVQSTSTSSTQASSGKFGNKATTHKSSANSPSLAPTKSSTTTTIRPHNEGPRPITTSNSKPVVTTITKSPPTTTTPKVTKTIRASKTTSRYLGATTPQNSSSNATQDMIVWFFTSLIILMLLILGCFVHYHFAVEIHCLSSCRIFPTNPITLEMKVIHPLKKRLNIPFTYKISARDLVVDAELIVGEGQFSKVYQGHIKHVMNENKSVVVKVNKLAEDANEMRALINDFKMRILIEDKHENIVSLLGVCINRREGKVLIAMESENARNLREYLTCEKSEAGENMILQKMTREKREEIKMTWCGGITNGMEFLHGQKIIHGNLAAENILVFPDQNNSVKITGFSHSQQLEENSTYVIKIRNWTCGWETSGWKWMPMEALRYMEFSRESDVWSFGVVMWEIFSLGAIPYIANGRYFQFSMEYVQKLEFGVRLSQPELASREMFRQMEGCWSRYGKDRPSFTALSQYFKDVLDSDSSDRFNTYACCNETSSIAQVGASQENTTTVTTTAPKL